MKTWLYFTGLITLFCGALAGVTFLGRWVHLTAHGIIYCGCTPVFHFLYGAGVVMLALVCVLVLYGLWEVAKYLSRRKPKSKNISLNFP
jgi:hypothetical protein